MLCTLIEHIEGFFGIFSAKSDTDHMGPLGDLIWNDPFMQLSQCTDTLHIAYGLCCPSMEILQIVINKYTVFGLRYNRHRIRVILLG